MKNSIYKPVKVSDFEASKLRFFAMGVSIPCTAGVSSVLDIKLNDDYLITGSQCVVNNGTYGDNFKIEIVDVDNIIGYGAGVILNVFADGWRIRKGDYTFAIEVPYPAKIYADLYIRITYTSIGTTDPGISFNLLLHKVLI